MRFIKRSLTLVVVAAVFLQVAYAVTQNDIEVLGESSSHIECHAVSTRRMIRSDQSRCIFSGRSCFSCAFCLNDSEIAKTVEILSDAPTANCRWFEILRGIDPLKL